MNQTVERNSNIELYRIIVMMMIVAFHYVVNSGLYQVYINSPITTHSVIISVIGGWGKVGINCFVLITGYFMCTSHITMRKYLKLLFEVIFYNVVIYLVFAISGVIHFSAADFIRTFIPVKSVTEDFVHCFLLFYFFIPFLNIFVKELTQRQHFMLLSLCLFVYSILGTLWGNSYTGFRTNYVTWFCILFFIASYIRFYNPFERFRLSMIGWMLGGAILVSVICVIYVLYRHIELGNPRTPFSMLSDCYKILAVIVSTVLFGFFLRLKVPQSKVVNRIASSCFGVLLIHANSDVMRQWLWKDFLHVADYYNSSMFLVHYLGSVLGIYIICTVIDQIRIMAFETPLFRAIDNMSSLSLLLNKKL